MNSDEIQAEGETVANRFARPDHMPPDDNEMKTIVMRRPDSYWRGSCITRTFHAKPPFRFVVVPARFVVKDLLYPRIGESFKLQDWKNTVNSKSSANQVGLNKSLVHRMVVEEAILRLNRCLGAIPGGKH